MIIKFETIQKLKESRISTRPFFNPLSSLKAYAGYEYCKKAKILNKNSYNLSCNAINIPSCMNLSKQDVFYVASEIMKII